MVGGRFIAALFGVLSIGLAAGCGGGGGGGGAAALPPVTPSNPSSSGAASSPLSVAFTIAVPSTASSARSRRPAYVSAATKSAAVSAGGSRQVVNCTTVCTLSVQVLPGVQTFVATLYDGAGGTGNVLSTGQTTATIAAGQANSVAITFDGVPAKLGVTLSASSVTAGASTQIAVTVAAIDAGGYTIVGADPYANAIAVSDDDTSGATSLSASSLSAPGASVTLSYNGAAALNAAHITASIPGASVAAQTATLSVNHPAPAPTATPVAPASGAFADHVQNFAYYGLNNQDADIPAAYMAAHVDIVEDDGFSAQSADAFKRAGGKIALSYTDPSYVPHCPAPFTPPAGTCQGPIGNLVAADESAWLHDASGARVNRFVDNYFQYQEALNVGSVSAQNAYRKAVAGILAASPRLDGFEADDSGSPWSNHFGGFDAVGVEIGGDAAWISAEQTMLAVPGKPVIINGGDPSTLGASYNGAFVDQASVMGQMFEGCFSNADGAYLYTDANGNQFEREVDGLLNVQSHRKLALCMPTGSATDVAKRTYAYAAFMLAYDPQYSVYGMVSNGSDGDSLYPETQLVPTAPRVTATEVGQLRVGSVYAREFAACAIAGQAIGPCAAVVNSSPSASAAVPAFATAYAHSIALDTASIYHGGHATVVSGTPVTLAAQSAAIFVR